MKKTFLMAFVLVAVVSLGVVGSAFAQSGNPPFDGEQGPRDGSGLLHDYMATAIADVFGVSVEELQASHDAGERIYDIALAQGIAVEEIPVLMQTARVSALEAALADGVITQEQVDQMQSRGGKRGGRTGSGRGSCDGSGQLESGRGGFGQQSAQ